MTEASSSSLGSDDAGLHLDTALVACVLRLADAMHQARPAEVEVREFLGQLLHRPQSEGGKEVWSCTNQGLITEIEARDLVLAHLATWLSHTNECAEPSCEVYSSDALEAAFEQALFGRRAHPVPGIDTVRR